MAPAQPHFPTAAFLIPPHTQPQGCKSPEMVKMQQHFSPALHISEDRRQADRQADLPPFPPTPFLHAYAKIIVTEGEITKISLCHQKSTYEIKPKFTE